MMNARTDREMEIYVDKRLEREREGEMVREREREREWRNKRMDAMTDK